MRSGTTTEFEIRCVKFGPAVGGGFSLLELVLVTAIIAVMAAIAVPRFGRASGRYRADLAARRIVADLAYLQSAARRSSCLKRAVFDSGADQYTMEGIADMDRPGQVYTVNLSDPKYGADLASATFQNSNGYVSTTYLSFDMWGRPQCGDPPGNPMAPLVSGSIVVQVGAETRTITVDPITGGATIQ
jgi:prepilin-type N-terminal cleavage/methylation domain-containing protein